MVKNISVNVESESLKALENLKDAIISTGGGAPCYNDNMDFMLEQVFTVYLKLTPEQLKTRLSHSKTVRPLIKDLEGKDLVDFIETNFPRGKNIMNAQRSPLRHRY